MTLPAVDFESIKNTAQEALAAYGTPATFTEQGAALGRPVKCVVYRPKTEPLLQDVSSTPELALLSPEDFQAPNRLPRQFDLLTVDVGGFKSIYAIEAVNAVFAADKLALLSAEVRAN